MFEENSFLVKFIKFVIFVSGLCEKFALVSVVWLLFTGKWKFILGSFFVIVISRLIIGLAVFLCSIPMAFLYHIVNFEMIGYVLIWLIASIWSYFVIFYTIIFAETLEINIILAMCICFFVADSPFIFTSLRTIYDGHQEIIPDMILLSTFVEFALLLSLITIIIFPFCSVMMIVSCSFSFCGIIYLLISYKSFLIKKNDREDEHNGY